MVICTIKILFFCFPKFILCTSFCMSHYVQNDKYSVCIYAKKGLNLIYEFRVTSVYIFYVSYLSFFPSHLTKIWPCTLSRAKTANHLQRWTQLVPFFVLDHVQPLQKFLGATSGNNFNNLISLGHSTSLSGKSKNVIFSANPDTSSCYSEPFQEKSQQISKFIKKIIQLKSINFQTNLSPASLSEIYLPFSYAKQ